MTEPESHPLDQRIAGTLAKFQFDHIPTPMHGIAHAYRLFAIELVDSVADKHNLNSALDSLLQSRDDAVRRAVQKQRDLVEVLKQIEEHDTDYDTRFRLVWQAVDHARAVGYSAGVRIDPTEPEWPVVYIELPTGQVSWHMPQHPETWDGHDTAEKYRRLREFVASTKQAAP